MSNKKRKKRRLEGMLKTTLVKAQARNVIGAPPPTKVKRGRTIRTVRPTAQIDLDTRYQGEFIRMTTYVEEEPQPNYVHSPLSISVPTPKQWPSTGRTQPGVRFSPEVVTNADHLYKTQGEKAATDYLNSIKEGEQMSSNVIGGATLETALKDAKEKADFHRRQASTHLGEANKWQQVQEGLENILKIATTPAKAVTSMSTKPQPERFGGPRAGSGFWGQAIVQHFKTNPTPVRKAILRDALAQLRPGMAATTPYGAISTAIKIGVLQEDSNELLSPGPNFPETQNETNFQR